MTEVFISAETDNDDVHAVYLRDLINATNLLHAEFVPRQRDNDSRELITHIENKITNCKYFIALVTPNSIHTQWMNQEIGYAYSKKKKIKMIIDKAVLSDVRGFAALTYIKEFVYVGANDELTKLMFMETAGALVESLFSVEYPMVVESFTDFELIKDGTIYYVPRKRAMLFLNGVVHPFQDLESVEIFTKHVKETLPMNKYKPHDSHREGNAIQMRPPVLKPIPENPFKEQK